ncbi:hypothetical protein R70723_27900 [Paenibacillus sp. FSL R7-0273]|uniref:radical SAM protein n=1 Tax=Paenibacillus sp. FSL R7-0273 TaxID=1536772 RepID=UPI0004F71423|nr:radical SAM protein [Paenibacillus sp. FSL R7-0273]AIQ49292.1 hypothetical protein R70723_27900 [Paenibacillus sp. FSL R7-0273]OMF88029.1 hypothetical protein BK144_22780 [Paenibacillus sp. FSL R7-0273]
MLYRQSKFANVFDKEENYVFFNAHTMGLFELPDEGYEAYQAYKTPRPLAEDSYSLDLAEQKFLVPCEHDEFAEAKLQRRTRRDVNKRIRKNRIGYMRISLTELCNLNCTYCFVNDIYQNKGSMSIEAFEDTMKWFIGQNQNAAPILQYFGGEPLIRMDLIKRGHEMLEEAQRNGQITGFTEEIVTNGTLVSEENARYFYEKKIMLVFSIDGWKEINDKNRIYHNGTGSYDAIVRGVHHFRNAGGRLSGIITPTKENLDIFSEIITHLVEDIGFTEISVNTPQPNEHGWDIDGAALGEAIIKAWMYCDKVNVPFNHPGNNIVFLVNNQFPQTNSCMNLTYGQAENSWGVYVTSDGQVSKCVVECDERCTSNFSDFSLDEAFIDWHFDDHSSKACLHCVGYNICGGPCTFEAIVREGKLNPEKCKFFKSVIPWAVTK